MQAVHDWVHTSNIIPLMADCDFTIKLPIVYLAEYRLTKTRTCVNIVTHQKNIYMCKDFEYKAGTPSQSPKQPLVSVLYDVVCE